MTRKDAERQESLTALHKWLKPGDKVNVILRHVSRSGMSRTITPMIFREDGTAVYLGYHVGRVLGLPTDGDHGVKIGGCGMDMGFELVYQLSHAMFPKGFKVEGRGRNGDTSGWDNDGGYALKHQWL